MSYFTCHENSRCLDKLGTLVSYGTIFLFPLIARYTVAADSFTLSSMLLCHVPHIVAALGEQSPRLMPSPTSEHAFRHLVYSLSMTSSALSIDWHALDAHLSTGWATNFLVVWLIATFSLYYFTLAHVAENWGASWLHVHQGDVTVLPMGIALIVALYASLPPEADTIFTWMRSTPFFIVIYVAWSTIHLCALSGFALHRTGRLDHEYYNQATLLGLFVAMPLAGLIELEAPLIYFAGYTFVAALVAQYTDLDRGVYSFRWIDVVLSVPWALMFVLVGALTTGYSSTAHVAMYASIAMLALSVSTTVGKFVIGPNFHVPMTLLMVLLVTAMTEQAETYAEMGVTFGQIIAVRLLLYGTYYLTHSLLHRRLAALDAATS